jgi:hypothetical protein
MNIDRYIPIYKAKRGHAVLRALHLYTGFRFKDEEIPFYIQLSYIPFAPEILNGLREFYNEPPFPFSVEGIKEFARFSRISKPDKLLSILKEAGFKPYGGCISHFEPYFLASLSMDDQGQKLLKDRAKLEEHILRDLENKNHTYPRYANHSEGPEEIKKLNMIQLLKVYKALEALKKKGFINRIAEEIRRDIEDLSSEHGGIILFDQRGELAIKVYPSVSSGNNDFYQPPKEAIRSDKFSDFHIHARTEDESPFAGPSDILGGDLSIPVKYARLGLPYTAMLFTKLRGNAFNSDIYFANPEDPLSPVVIDLGNYSY